jgi:hypothetical protein
MTHATNMSVASPLNRATDETLKILRNNLFPRTNSTEKIKFMNPYVTKRSTTGAFDLIGEIDKIEE